MLPTHHWWAKRTDQDALHTWMPCTACALLVERNEPTLAMEFIDDGLRRLGARFRSIDCAGSTLRAYLKPSRC